jgi:hypothetical protein
MNADCQILESYNIVRTTAVMLGQAHRNSKQVLLPDSGIVERIR